MERSGTISMFQVRAMNTVDPEEHASTSQRWREELE
jgi:hypothetical protein